MNLLTGEAVIRLLGSIAQHKAVDRQSVAIAVLVALMRGSVAGKNRTSGMSSSDASKRSRIVVLDEDVMAVHSVRTDVGVDLVGRGVPARG